MVGRAWYSCKPLRAGTRAGSAARSLCGTSARQVQRPEPFRSILGHSLRAPQRWLRLNFYENDFSDDVGRALFGEGVLSAQPDLCSPCNTSDGFLQKRWRIADRKRILLKAGSGIYQQEPYNEIVASALYDTLGMPHVSYWLVDQGGQVMSACECFTDERTELVTAAQFMRLRRSNRAFPTGSTLTIAVMQLESPMHKKMSAICWPPIIS